jgi:hypothetical protein
MKKAAWVAGTHRYFLIRQWDDQLPMMLWVMLNPSVADDEIDDPTIVRCIGFAKSWGYGGFMVVNLFSYRATDSNELGGLLPEEAVNLTTTAVLRAAFNAFKDELIVCAWGAKADAVLGLPGRGAFVTEMIRKAGGTPMCLSKTKAGHPGHPLYLKSDLTPQPL